MPAASARRCDRNRVDLPEAFGPSSAVTVPGRSAGTVTSRSTGAAAIGDGQCLDRQAVHRAGLRRAMTSDRKNGTPTSAVMMPIG